MATMPGLAVDPMTVAPTSGGVSDAVELGNFPAEGRLEGGGDETTFGRGCCGESVVA